MAQATQSFLLRLNDRLRSLGDADDIQYEAARALGEYLGATRVGYAEDVGDRTHVQVTRHFVVDGAAPVTGRLRYDAYGRDVLTEFEAGHSVVRDDVVNDPTLTAVEKAAYAALQVGSAANLPLVKDGRLLAVMFVHHAIAHVWTDEELELLEEVGQRTWSAVERARAENALREAHAELEQRVRERTAEIEALFQQVVTVQEDERRRIARDIHDHLGQQMTALRMNLESLRSSVDANAPVAAQVTRAIELAAELDHSMDFLTSGLRPAALDHLGLAAALEHLARGWSERLGIDVDFDAMGAERLRLPEESETHLYRIAQEALHNVFKHAGATHVTVSLVHREHRVLLIIEDNGRGFDTEATHPVRGKAHALGLIGMRERAMLFGGEFVVESAPGQGTAVFVRLPVPEAAPIARE
jgi:signal transduction histidine kinase